jgi:hypothetical protein
MEFRGTLKRKNAILYYMDRILAVLEFIESGGKSWAEINQYCEKVGLHPLACHDVLTDPKDPLVTEAGSRVMLSSKGHQVVTNSLVNASILGEDWA